MSEFSDFKFDPKIGKCTFYIFSTKEEMEKFCNTNLGIPYKEQTCKECKYKEDCEVLGFIRDIGTCDSFDTFKEGEEIKSVKYNNNTYKDIKGEIVKDN